MRAGGGGIEALARFAWHVVQADGAVLPDGLHLVELAADGRISRIIGYFGPLASK